MPLMSRIDPNGVIGRAPEQLSLEQRAALAGKFIALEIYSPQTLPLRLIRAIGDSAEDCIRQLSASGLNSRNFEFLPLAPL